MKFIYVFLMMFIFLDKQIYPSVKRSKHKGWNKKRHCSMSNNPCNKKS